MLILRIVTCIAAIVTAVAYARWHFWWWSGNGRIRMGLLLSIALRYGCAAGEMLAPHGTADQLLDTGIAVGSAGILACVLYLAYALTRKNIARIRDPDAAAQETREHLRQTPWASGTDIEKLLAYWDESHSHPPRCN